MNEHVTSTLMLGSSAAMAAIRSNIPVFILGMIPGSSAEPVIEKDLPDPV